MDDSFYIPTQYYESEFLEKRSRFIGRIWPIKTEEEAKTLIAETRKHYHDARHTCWCYDITDDNIRRYSDDGEPQGTAGQPMLELFSKRNITNYCCTVTRYFGGILLGTGGLVRAYTQTAALALEGSGISIVRMWKQFEIEIGYSFYERLKIMVSDVGGTIIDTDYSHSVCLSVLIPPDTAAELISNLNNLTSGKAVIIYSHDCYLPAIYREAGHKFFP